MAQPSPYVPTADFSQDEANNVGGRSTVRTGALDAEFANLQTTTDEICENLELIQRDDGKLQDGLVELYNLSASARAALNSSLIPRGSWVTATAYAINDMVDVSGITYVCMVAHTSGTFATDYAAGKWVIFTSRPTTAVFTVDRFSGTGAQTAFTLSVTPTSENNTEVYVSGVYIQKNVYSLSGAVLTFAVAPAFGTNNIEIATLDVTDYAAVATAIAAQVAAAAASAAASAASAVTANSAASLCARIIIGDF